MTLFAQSFHQVRDGGGAQHPPVPGSQTHGSIQPHGPDPGHSHVLHHQPDRSVLSSDETTSAILGPVLINDRSGTHDRSSVMYCSKAQSSLSDSLFQHKPRLFARSTHEVRSKRVKRQDKVHSEVRAGAAQRFPTLSAALASPRHFLFLHWIFFHFLSF